MIEKDIEKQKAHWEAASVCERRTPQHPLIRIFAENKIDEISKTVDFDAVDNALDIGCGNGYFTYYLQDRCDVLGGDFSEQMLVNNPADKVAHVDVCDIQFEDKSFDLVFSANLLHHIPHLEKALFEMVRVSKRYIVIVEPSLFNPLFLGFCSLKKSERLALTNRPSKISRIVQKHGLRLIDDFCHGAILPNVTPLGALRFLRFFDKRFLLGLYRVMIFER